MIIDKYKKAMTGKRRKSGSCQSGFTLLEVMIIVVIVGIIAAVASPSWMNFLSKQQVETARGRLRQGIQKAQLEAQRTGIVWQFSVKEVSGVIETSVHPMSLSPDFSVWESLNKNVQLDSETSLYLSGVSGVRYVRFDEKGSLNSRRGRVTVSSKRHPDIKRCVIVSTLLGATRVSKEQSTPNSDGKYCD